MAKQSVSATVSGAGLVCNVWRRLDAAVRERGGTDEDLHRLGTKEGERLIVSMADLIVGRSEPQLPQGGHPYRGGPNQQSAPFTIKVEYFQPDYAALKSAFDWVNDAYRTAKFDRIDRCKDVSREAREVTFEYLHLGRDATTDEILAEMDRQGFRPALYEELLAFAKMYPDEQRKFPIVALGSGTDVRGDRFVAYLWNDGDGRHLNLHWIGSDWNDVCRFLAVRK